METLHEILTNTSHLHLLLNHIPTTAFLVALVVFVVALINRSETLTKTSLALFFMIAAIAIGKIPECPRFPVDSPMEIREPVLWSR